MSQLNSNSKKLDEDLDILTDMSVSSVGVDYYDDIFSISNNLDDDLPEGQLNQVEDISNYATLQ